MNRWKRRIGNNATRSIPMAIRSDNDGDQYCMMMQLGKDFDGMCIPMGYWIVPDFGM